MADKSSDLLGAGSAIPESISKTDLACKKIRDAIVSGRLAPGAHLSQLKLAEELGVDQRTVREALAQLVARGLVTKSPNKHARVVELQSDDLQEIYLMRSSLEGLAMSFAAETITDTDLARMKALLPETGVGMDEESVRRAREANREFHWIAIRAAKRPYLEKILELVWELAFTYYAEEHTSREEKITSARLDLEFHEALLAALENGDGEKAQEVVYSHVSGDVWRGTVSRFSSSGQTTQKEV